MKRRITFVQRPDAPFELNQAVLKTDSLSINKLDGAREERVTLSFPELRSEISQVLKQCDKLHIRWATERPYDTGAPFSSRISPGLHVFFTPSGSGRSVESLCSLLKKLFDEELKCEIPEVSFINPPSQVASTAAALQYYSRLPSLDNLVTFIQHKSCDRLDEQCHRHITLLLSADSVDINYDSLSHALTLSGYWSRSPEDGWTEKIRKPDAATDKVEVGLLGAETAREPEEIKMGGLLGDVGQNDELKPTLFSFPSRHHSLPDDATYSIYFPAPTGLHPTMTISVSRSSLEAPPAPPDTTCSLHTYLTLPSLIFGDKYQLSTTDPLFLNSHNLVALRAVAGETDLEAPDWFVSGWGSNWLIELATPSVSDVSPEEWNVTIPLHLRYDHPSESGYRPAVVPWPVVFWACTAEDDTEMGINPFDRVNLGWEGLFGPRTMFYQLRPSPSGSDPRLVEELDVPVLKLKADEGIFQSKIIELGTVVVIVLGLLWVLGKLGLVAWSSGTGTRKRTDKQGKTE